MSTFIDIASLFAGRDDEHSLSQHFCYSFLEQHEGEILAISPGSLPHQHVAWIQCFREQKNLLHCLKGYDKEEKFV